MAAKFSWFLLLLVSVSLTMGVVGAYDYDENCVAVLCETSYYNNTYDNRGCTLLSCQSNCCNSYNKSVGVCNPNGGNPNSQRCDCQICTK
ncbi:hypothetical protein OROGR_013264 [Orobanche gracilis]